MKQRGPNLLEREGTRSVLASVISIIIGMLVGSILILIMGLSNSSLGLGWHSPGIWRTVQHRPQRLRCTDMGL